VQLIRQILCSVLALHLLSGCAAQIIKSGVDESKVIYAGVTEIQLTERLGQPISKVLVTPNCPAIQMWERDHQVSLFEPNTVTASEAVFRFKGRLDKDARAGQAGFDSFMTLGLAELYLIPKAIWERSWGEDLQLKVWFSVDGRALAYKWSPLVKQ
jgi:hypothetical protein